MKTTTRKPMQFSTIPTWAIDADRRDRYTVAAAFQLAGLTGEWVRLTAETQRAVFGAVLFGKCRVLVGDGGIRYTRSVCYGTDSSTGLFAWADVERHMATGRRPVM